MAKGMTGYLSQRSASTICEGRGKLCARFHCNMSANAGFAARYNTYEKDRKMSDQLPWVKLDKYVESTGDTADSVMARRKIGKWLDGKQCKMVDGRLWINLPAVNEWIEKWEPHSQFRQA